MADSSFKPLDPRKNWKDGMAFILEPNTKTMLPSLSFHRNRTLGRGEKIRAIQVTVSHTNPF